MPKQPTVTEADLRSIGGRLGTAVRHHPERDNSELRTELAKLRAHRSVEEILDGAPALSTSQRNELVRLIRSHPGESRGE